MTPSEREQIEEAATTAVAAMTDEQLVDYVSDAAEMAARCHGFSEYDVQCSVAYAECQRRARPELYERGYDDAYEACTGHLPRPRPRQ